MALRNSSYRDTCGSSSSELQQNEEHAETKAYCDVFQSSGYKYDYNMVISKPTPNQSPFPYTFSDNDNRNSISLSALLSPQNKITPKPSEISPKEVSVRLCPGSNTKQRENCLSD